MRKVTLAAIVAALLAACQSAPVDRSCGVIVDGLRDVRGATPADDRRIDRHHARGKGAGCWE